MKKREVPLPLTVSCQEKHLVIGVGEEAERLEPSQSPHSMIGYFSSSHFCGMEEWSSKYSNNNTKEFLNSHHAAGGRVSKAREKELRVDICHWDSLFLQEKFQEK